MSSLYASKSGVANLTRGLASEWSKRVMNVDSLAPSVFYQLTWPDPSPRTGSD